MPKMCYKCAQGMSKISPIMLKICSRYCRISKTSPTDSLTGPPTWIQEMLAHPKKLLLSFVIVMNNFIARKYIFGRSLISEIQRMFRDAQCPFLIFFCARLWLKENDLKISTKEPKHNTLGRRWHGDCCETPKWEKEGKIQFHWLSMQEQSR